MLYVCRFLWPLRLRWLLACCLYKEVYLQIFKRVSYWLHNFFFIPPAHLCAAKYMTEISLIVTLNNQVTSPIHGCCGDWEGWARKPVNDTSWVDVVTPTDRPKSVSNRYVIECGVVCVVTSHFWHFCCIRGFCHRIESDLFLFLFLWICVMHDLEWHLPRQ